MTNYTLICYRPDATDRCGDSTSSDFDIHYSTDLTEITRKLADVLYVERTSNRHTYADWDIYFLIDGVPRHEEENDIFVVIKSQARAMVDERIARAKTEKEERERAERAARNQNEADRKAVQ